MHAKHRYTAYTLCAIKYMACTLCAMRTWCAPCAPMSAGCAPQCLSEASTWMSRLGARRGQGLQACRACLVLQQTRGARTLCANKDMILIFRGVRRRRGLEAFQAHHKALRQLRGHDALSGQGSNLLDGLPSQPKYEPGQRTSQRNTQGFLEDRLLRAQFIQEIRQSLWSRAGQYLIYKALPKI
eukprot:1156596-Pelagomonas_calceolata.AAC.2